MEICFATNNANKLREIREAVGSSIKILSLQDIGCNEELPETQKTIEGNSLQKAKYVFDKYKVACFADDTGLEVAALNGEPGVYSARYAGPDCSSEDNIALLLKKLTAETNRTAQFKTVITYVTEGNEKQFLGIAKGVITEAESGEDGFGYDPIFQPKNYSITFSEMTMEEKNAISHRGKATRLLIDYLSSK